MSFIFNEEINMLQESAAKFLSEHVNPALLRTLRDADDECRCDQNKWQEMIEMGWSAIAIPEEFGGLDFGYLGLGVVLQEVGRNLSSSPLESSILISSTLVNEVASTSQKEDMLPAIASGEQLYSAAIQEGPHFSLENHVTTATKGDGFWELSGEKLLVLDAVAADKFIVSASTGALLPSLFVVDTNAEGVVIERRIMIDSRVSAKVSLNAVQVKPEAMLGDSEKNTEEYEVALTRALDIISVGLSAELLGLSQEAFMRTCEYIKERKQFGRKIGSFQSLQHRAAIMYSELELCQSLVVRALNAIDEKHPKLSVYASAAKAKLSEVAKLVTNESIQMHGGIGMTDEYDIGFFIKRARVLQHLFGDANYHYDRFATLKGY